MTTPRRSTITKTTKVPPKSPIKPTIKTKVKSEVISPRIRKSWRTYLPHFQMNTVTRIGILLLIVGAIMVLSPKAGIFHPNQSSNPDTTQVYQLDIRNRATADPHQATIQVKVNSRSILSVTTDEDGRIDLVSRERDVFNPVFYNIGNTLTIPTDRLESFRVEFHPVTADNSHPASIVLGTVIVQN